MKKLIIATIFLLLGFSTTQSQSLTLVEGWTTHFNWNGLSDVTRKIMYHESNIYVSGYKDGTVGDVHSGLIKANTANGDTLFTKVDTTTMSINDLQFCIVGNKIYYLSSGNSNYLVIRDLSGGLISVKKLESRMSFCEYGDSVIAVTSQNPARIKIFSQTGDTTRSFSLGYSLSQGFVSLKRFGNELWICGLYYSSGYNGFIEKRNIISGSLLWRKNFVGANPIYATIDTSENAYVVATYSGLDSIAKIGTTGNTIWSKLLLSQQDLYVWDVAVDIKNQIVITGGFSINAGCITAHKMSSGDSVFAFPVLWNSAHTNAITGVTCDTSGNFYVTGYDYISSTTMCHVRKYHYDTITGITLVGGEHPTAGFTLSQNYPNPFNPTTKINFSVPKKSHITLKVYDILGKEVITLVNEEKNAGSYAVDFNGSKLTSGNYFYRIEAGDFTETKKMTLVK